MAPKDHRIRVVFDTDAKNEIDDIWAIALAILSPERFHIEGFVVANFDNNRPEVGPDSIEASAREIETILAKAGLAGQYPIKRGSPPINLRRDTGAQREIIVLCHALLQSTCSKASMTAAYIENGRPPMQG